MPISEENRIKLIKLKQRQMAQAGDQILTLGDEITKMSAHLKEKKASDKSVRVAKARIVTHNKDTAMDLTKRPADRGLEIRSYTKMDLDIWKYEQVRDWFNKDAVPETPYRYIPSETGYMIRAD